MNSNIIKINKDIYVNTLNNLFFFYYLFMIIISGVNSLYEIQIFSAFNTFTDDIMIITNNGFLYYNPYSKNITNADFSEKKIYLNEDNRMSFSYAKFPSTNHTLYTWNNSFIFFKNSIKLQYYYIGLKDNYKVLIPYKEKGNNLQFIFLIIIKSNLYIRLYNTSTSTSNSLNILSESIIKYQEEIGNYSKFTQDTITCQLMIFKDFTNETLICFIGLEPYQLIAYAFNIENNFTIIDNLLYNETEDKNITSIKSILSEDKKKCLICYAYMFYTAKCLIYNSEENKWNGESFKIFNNCVNKNYFLNFLYLSETQEYIFYCFLGRFMFSIFSFDKDFKLKTINNSTYSNRTIMYNRSLYWITSDLIYLPKEKMFLLLYSKEYNGTPYLYENEICFNEKSLFLCKDGNNNTISLDNDNINNYTLNNTTIINTESIEKDEKNIKFVKNGNIMSSNIDIVKEQIPNKLDNIINQIETGINYKINGKDYDILISPIDKYKYFNSTYIDLGECENILRKKYNLSSNEIISIMGIEIDPLNEKVLGKQIEYIVFDENKNKLNLSLCQDISIIIDYKIINSSIINETMVLYYLDLNIDIFNSEDQFFNNICFPYSIEDTDLILKDRINDIYQNYSLCEDNCEYQKLDIKSNSVKCQCKIKTEIKTENKLPVFHKILLNSLKDSNFGVIECYRQVFSLSNKFKNVGFIISLIILLLHIPLYIIFFIYKIKSVKGFVFVEMKKNNYFNKIKYNKSLNSNNNETHESQRSEDSDNKQNRYENRKQTEVTINNKTKIRTRKSIRHRSNRSNNSNMRSTINYQMINEQKNNDNEIILPVSNTKELLRFTSTPKKIKKIFKKSKDNDYDENVGSQSLKSLKLINVSKRMKKVKFDVSKNKVSIFKRSDANASKMKLMKDSTNPIDNMNARRSVREIKRASQIFKKLLGNEEKKIFPGFYNLIHVNINNTSENRPLDSKYILDNYCYESAIKYDKRSFLRIYFICLLSKENILNTFFFKSPLELQSIRLCLFLFVNSCDCALNAFFYINQKISDRYHYKGTNLLFYSIINNITISITSTLVSFCLVKSLSFLSNSKDDIIDIFRKEEEKMRNDKNFKYNNLRKSQIVKKLHSIFRKLKIKIISFIIIEIFIILFFCYYMIAFCEVYKKTQVSWIIDSGVSFLISIPIEFASALLMAIFYYFSIRKNWKCIYNIVLFFYSLG